LDVVVVEPEGAELMANLGIVRAAFQVQGLDVA
jgi:hypothetical protein